MTNARARARRLTAGESWRARAPNDETCEEEPMERTVSSRGLGLVAAAALCVARCGPVPPGGVANGDGGASVGADGGDGAAVASGALHGCTQFDDRTDPVAMREVHFHSPRYSPSCMTVAAGQDVLFMGPMDTYPLRPGVAPSRANDTGAASANPIPATSTGEYVTVTFAAPGLYPFYCPSYEGSTGMYGVIQVR